MGMLYLVVVSPLVLPDDAKGGVPGESHGGDGCRADEYLTEVKTVHFSTGIRKSKKARERSWVPE